MIIIMKNCAECGEVFKKKEMLRPEWSTLFWYCDNCFHSVFTPCEFCGEPIEPGTGVHHPNEGYSECDKCLGVTAGKKYR